MNWAKRLKENTQDESEVGALKQCMFKFRVTD